MDHNNVLLTDKRYQNQVRFWEEKFSGQETILNESLSTDLSAFISLETELPGYFTDIVNQIAQDDLGKFTVVCSVFAIVFSKYLQTAQPIIFTPSLSAAENNQFIPLLFNVSRDQSLRALILDIKSVMRDSYTFSDISIKHCLRRHLSLELQSLSDILISCKQIHTLPVSDLQAKIIVEIDLQEQIAVRLKYSEKSDLFGVMPYITLHLNNVTKSYSDLNQSIDQVQLLVEEERQKMLFGFNDTKLSYPSSRTIVELFKEQVGKTPLNLSICSESGNFSYRELDLRSNQLAHYLKQEYKILPDDVIGLLASRSPQMIIGMLAILKAGGAYLPIDPNYPKDRIGYMISDSGLKLLLAESTYMQDLQAYKSIVCALDGVLLNLTTPSTDLIQTSGPNNLAYVIYTSGSTGRPKGVMIEQHSLVNLCIWHQDYYRVRENSKATLYAGVGFDASTWEIWPYLLAGATLIPVPDHLRLSIEHLMLFMDQMQITHTFLPTKIAEQVMSSGLGNADLTILTGGEKLNFQSYGPSHVVDNYGPTESTIVATSRRLFFEADNVNSIGKPIANTRIYILDEYFEMQPIGVVGEICIAGAGLARGYLNHAELTAEKFFFPSFNVHERLYKTGDKGKWMPDGSIHFAGRKDSQVKIRGHRIELDEIEKTICEYHTVKQSVVVVVDNADRGQLLIACIVFHRGQSFDTKAIRRFLYDRLPEYMVPVFFKVLEEMPFTPNGKLNRNFLARTNDLQTAQEGKRLLPKTDTEHILTRIWENALAAKDVSIDANFFELGGQSMQAIRIMSEIEKAFGLALPASFLFQEPTIEKLAKLLNQKRSSYERSCLVTFQADGNKSPLFFIHPVGGQVFCYSELAKFLGSDQPFYGLQCIGLQDGEEPVRNLQDMARHYIADILKISPQLPIHIGGWSFGGLVAHEIVHQLEQQQIKVGSLTLIDTSHPSDYRTDELSEAGLLRAFASDLLSGYNIGTDDWREAHIEKSDFKIFLQRILVQGKRLDILPKDMHLNQLTRMWKVFETHCHAMYAYRPKTILTAINLFISAPGGEPTTQNSEAKWLESSGSQGRAYRIDACHYSIIRQPAIRHLVNELKKQLQ